ncbi:MAG: dienelactone hydrolase family protein [Opitutales bacterium]|jgi:dienelactone hydrolase
MRILASLITCCVVAASAADSLKPYATEAEVPRDVVSLWKDVDFRKDPLDVRVLKEWKEDGAVCRYVTFSVGTFKGAPARIAAFYTFPEGAKGAPAFVWAHGGGQRAERQRGAYFAKHGYATVDINWGGREIEPGVTENTDWGQVDPTQGPQFYPKAFRGVKQDFLPDPHTIDPVLSPRNGNWYLLAYAGRRAITFLESQPEVDPARIGFTGYSMGGNITSFVAIDPRLKAVAPMVGGTGFVSSPFPGIPDPGHAHAYRGHADLFAATMESQSYYPHVKCPVLMLTATNDFHGTVDRAFDCMKRLPHDDWRVSLKLHYNHGLGAEQWLLLNLWFGRHLKGEQNEIPRTAKAKLDLAADGRTATFTVHPDRPDRLRSLRVLYSHDPNPQSRFWKDAAAERQGDVWTARLPVLEGLPLFTFADCAYPMPGGAQKAFEGSGDAFTVASVEGVHHPKNWDLAKLSALGTQTTFTPDFSRGWGSSPSGGLTTYKFRDPEMLTPGPEKALRLTLAPSDKRLGVRLRVSKNKFLTGVRAPGEDYSANVLTRPGQGEVIISLSDFIEFKTNQAGEKVPMKDWRNIATLTLEIIDQGRPLQLSGNPLPRALDWVDAPAR